MQAIFVEKPWDVKVIQRKVPVLEDNHSLVQIVAAGICGSDINAFRGTNGLVTYPRIIGHEVAGIVRQVKGNNPVGLKIGDRVVVEPYIYCGHCYPCSIGRTNCCTDLKVLGVHVDGGMADYLAHPTHLLHRIPEGMSWVEAAMAEPLTIGLHAVHRGGVKVGEFCVVIGAGPIGLVTALVSQAYGATAIIMDLVQERLNYAKSLGINHIINSEIQNATEQIRAITEGNMAQVIMECTGANSAIRATLDYVSHAGRIILTGWPKSETMLPTDIITRKEIDIRGSRNSAGEFKEALQLIQSKKIDINKILTRTVPVEMTPAIIREIEKNPGQYMKVVVRFEE